MWTLDPSDRRVSAVANGGCSYLVPAKVVDEDHAEEDGEQAEALEGQNGQAEGAVLLRHAGGVVLAVGAALLTGQAVAGRALVSVWATFCCRSLFYRTTKATEERTNPSFLCVFAKLEPAYSRYYEPNG